MSPFCDFFGEIGQALLHIDVRGLLGIASVSMLGGLVFDLLSVAIGGCEVQPERCIALVREPLEFEVLLLVGLGAVDTD